MHVQGPVHYDAGSVVMELDALSGTVMRMAREPTMSTPFNFAVYAALQLYADGSFATGTDAFPAITRES